jgi:hypothetical protein
MTVRRRILGTITSTKYIIDINIINQFVKSLTNGSIFIANLILVSKITESTIILLDFVIELVRYKRMRLCHIDERRIAI